MTDLTFLLPSGLPGLYARTEAFEAVARLLDRLITDCAGGDNPERLHFPPVIDQKILQKNGYFIGFPHLAGCIHSFQGSRGDHGRLLYKLLGDDPTGDEFTPTGCALTPAACYPVYPLIAARGCVPEQGVLVDVESYCFRHEPSDDPARMQSFRMREYVRIGSPDQVNQFRHAWRSRALQLVDSLGLPGRIEAAHDPFFGAAGDTLIAGQHAESLKLEVLIPVSSATQPAACISLNYHKTHFAAAWGLRRADDGLSHSACIGFGIERLVMALFLAHGPDFEQWPTPLRQMLRPAP